MVAGSSPVGLACELCSPFPLSVGWIAVFGLAGMFSYTKDQVVYGLISFLMLAAIVYGSVDACLSRVNSYLAAMPDDASRIILVGAGFLGFLLAAFRLPD